MAYAINLGDFAKHKAKRNPVMKKSIYAFKVDSDEGHMYMRDTKTAKQPC